MKKILFIALLVTATLISGCIDVTEELFLSKQGDGQYSITIDMSALIELSSMGDMFGDLDLGGEEEIEEEEEDDVIEDRKIERNKEEEETDDLAGLGGLDALPEKMDTIISFSDMPDSVRSNITHPEHLEKGYMRMQLDKEEGEMLMSFNVDFEELEDIQKFFDALSETQMDEEAGAGMFGQAGDGFMQKAMFRMVKKRVIERRPNPAPSDDMFEEEGMEFAKMMFGGAKYTTIYHLPGTIKSTTIPGAEIDGKTLTVEADMLEVMEGKTALDGQIKFKNK